MGQFSLILSALAAVHVATADVYMHNPRGSNDRGCETNENRNNGDRLFDSQNNAAGGYACPYAWPFACYQMPVEADRDACNKWNGDPAMAYDDISNLGLMDDEGVLHPKGTRTPKLYFYEGSILQIEWTNQHGCGENPRTHCDIVLQYACEDTLTDDCGEPDSGKKCGPRDGHPMTNNDDGRGTATYDNIDIIGGQTQVDRRARDREATATIPLSIDHNVQSDPRFARHEPLSFYVKCRTRERNKGLYTADQNVRDDATGTRQNPNGNRDGYECPEEAHYWPYWGPSPWKDIAILTDRTDQCGWMVSQSQNIKEKYECVCPTCPAQNRLVPNNKAGCTMVGGTWTMVPAHNIPAPVCGPAPTTRENQLGNPIGGGKSASSFNWTIPQNVPAGNTCILRLRYNISTGDNIPGTNTDVTVFGTSANNAGNSPLKDRQNSESAAYKGFIEMPVETFPAAKLGLAINTNQFGRTFQDRSWSFEIRRGPSGGECAGKRIYNLNVRGKRGNIVQTYPSVEYDYVPNEMYVLDSDCIHVQWTGSDYNPARNANDGYGGPPDPNNLNNGRADRNNLVQLFSPDEYQPVTSFDYHFNMFATSRQRKINLAFIGQPVEDTDACMTIDAILSLSAMARNNPGNALYNDAGQNYLDDNNDRDRYWKNCGKLSNAKTPYFDGGLLRPGGVGTYYFMNTRSNSFSNRNMQGVLHVQNALLANGSIIFVVLGGILGMALAGAGFVSYRRRQNRIAELDGEPVKGAPGTGLVALLPFGRRGSPHALAGAAEPAAPAVPRRARPGAVTSAAVAGGAGGGAVKGIDDVTTVTALHNHQASEAGELEFRKGDIITVLRKDDSGWWEGRTPDGKKGIFPANYVRLNN